MVSQSLQGIILLVQGDVSYRAVELGTAKNDVRLGLMIADLGRKVCCGRCEADAQSHIPANARAAGTAELCVNRNPRRTR